MTKNITIVISVGLTALAMATLVALNWIALPQSNIDTISAAELNEPQTPSTMPNWVEFQTQVQQSEAVYQQRRIQLEKTLTQRDAEYTTQLNEAQTQMKAAEANLVALEQARLDALARIETLQQAIQTGDEQYQAQANILISQLQTEESQIQAEIAQTLSQLEAVRAELNARLTQPSNYTSPDFQAQPEQSSNQSGGNPQYNEPDSYDDDDHDDEDYDDEDHDDEDHDDEDYNEGEDDD